LCPVKYHGLIKMIKYKTQTVVACQYDKN